MIQTNTSFVLCGPSGSGKATLSAQIITLDSEIKVVGSYTTRNPKIEIHGKEYVQCLHGEFWKLVDDGKIMEFNNYAAKNLYGTSRESFNEIRKSGKIPLFDVEINGVQQLKNYFAKKEQYINGKSKQERLVVFFLRCEIEELERRLRARGAENEQQIQERLATARQELQFAQMLKSMGIIDHIIDYGKGAEIEKTARYIYGIMESELVQVA